MHTYSMTCKCGDSMKIEAASRDEAATKMKSMWTAEMVEKHMKEKHPGEPLISLAECHAMIDKDLAEVA